MKSIKLCLIIAFLFSACNQPPTAPKGARALTDEIGRSVRLNAKPQRIISLAPNLTEILFALDAGDRIIANTTWCDFPEAAKKKEKIGDTQRPNLERIIALKPDLVLVSTASQLQELTNRLTSLGISVYVSNPDSLEKTLIAIDRIAEAIGEAAKGKEVTDKLRQRIETVKQKITDKPRPRVLLLLQEYAPLFTVGPGAYTTDLIALAGGDSISSKLEWPNPYPQMSPEAAVARRPEIIVFSSSETATVELVKKFPIVDLKETPAARNGQSYRVNASHLVLAAPRIVDGLEELARIFHPTAFKE